MGILNGFAWGCNVLNRAYAYSPVCVCYSFNLSPFVFVYEEDKVSKFALYKIFISRRVLAPSSAKYKVL